MTSDGRIPYIPYQEWLESYKYNHGIGQGLLGIWGHRPVAEGLTHGEALLLPRILVRVLWEAFPERRGRYDQFDVDEPFLSEDGLHIPVSEYCEHQDTVFIDREGRVCVTDRWGMDTADAIELGLYVWWEAVTWARRAREDPVPDAPLFGGDGQ